MNMESRILKRHEKAKLGNPILSELDAIRIESIKRDAEKRNIDQIRKLLDKVPTRFREKNFSNFISEHSDQAKTKSICERFVLTFKKRLEEGNSLMFLGNPGTGKTLLSLIIYQSIVKAGFHAQYESSLSFLRILQEKRFESSAAFQSILDTYKRCDLLILDEVTESLTKDGFPSEYDQKLLFEVVNARYEIGNRCTIVISNRDKSELKNRIGNPVYDRLSENGITLAFNWDSYRQKRKE